jgi:hypothetical protein
MIQFFNKLFGVQVLAPVPEAELMVMPQADQEAIEAYASASEPSAEQIREAVAAYWRNLGSLKPREGIHMEFMSEATNKSRDLAEIRRTRQVVVQHALEKLETL